MNSDEVSLFAAFLRCARRYREFGTGGSTVLACNLVPEAVVSIDSSKVWQQNVFDECRHARTAPTLVHVDIGPVGEWGYPTDHSQRASWLEYFRPRPELEAPDVCLIDGRFRVACALSTLIEHPHCIVLLHDSDRSHYRVVHQFAHEIARAGVLSAFCKRTRGDEDLIREELSRFSLDPA